MEMILLNYIQSRTIVVNTIQPNIKALTFSFTEMHLKKLTASFLKNVSRVVLCCIRETTNKASETLEAVPSNGCQQFSGFTKIVLRSRYSFHLLFRDAAIRNEPLFQFINFDHVNQTVKVYVDNLYFIVCQRSYVIFDLVEI